MSNIVELYVYGRVVVFRLGEGVVRSYVLIL
jgi:hypothetical protein